MKNLTLPLSQHPIKRKYPSHIWYCRPLPLTAESPNIPASCSALLMSPVVYCHYYTPDVTSWAWWPLTLMGMRDPLTLDNNCQLHSSNSLTRVITCCPLSPESRDILQLFHWAKCLSLGLNGWTFEKIILLSNPNWLSAWTRLTKYQGPNFWPNHLSWVIIPLRLITHCYPSWQLSNGSLWVSWYLCSCLRSPGTNWG